MTVRQVLIVGCGSVGKRHARNFRALGFAVSGVDPREDRAAELANEGPVVATYRDLEHALASERFDGVVIGSPPSAHVQQAQACLAAGIPVLMEKPVSPDLSGARLLADVQHERGVPLLLGYTWRWWPPLQRVRELLRQRAVGNLRHVRFVMSAHLADWHPWERYQDFFMARREQGGGALLDESHWIDLACWLFGLPCTVIGQVGKLSNLEIDTDDNVDLHLSYDDNLRVALHLDLYGRPHEKSITFVGEEGTLRWTADPNEIVIGRGMSGWDQREVFTCERNDMFMAVAREFVDVLAGSTPSCDVADGVRVLQVIQAARLSSERGSAIDMRELVS